MPDGIDLSVGGLDKFRLLRARLKDADKQIRLAFLRAVRTAALPLRDAVRQSALGVLPKRGGLAAKIADSKYATRTTAQGVSFKITNPYQIKTIDAGTVRHPVFGDRLVWVAEPVTPGFWTEPITKAGPTVLAKVDQAMNDAARAIQEGI